MDKMREEFEAWISHYIGGSWLRPDSSRVGEYFDNNTQSMWEAWQASRAALRSNFTAEHGKYRDEMSAVFDDGWVIEPFGVASVSHKQPK